MKSGSIQRRLVTAGIFLLVGFWTLGPLVWIGITSLKPAGSEFRMPVEYWPTQPTLDNYRTVVGPRFTIQQSIWNSVVVSSIAMVLTLVLASLAAYAIARLRFRWYLQSLIILQLAGMVPPIAVIAPTFLLTRSLGLLQTYAAMILPNAAYGIPLASFLIASYLHTIPFELEDAARIDGAGNTRILFSVLLPVAAPGIAAAAVLVFLGSWGEFMLANTVTLGSAAVRTAPVAILTFSRAFQLQWSWIAAGILLTLLPLLVGVLILQRYITMGFAGDSLR
ncbi:carbohydrate ABC transporter permease [Spirochaeta africana]|uniref:Maltose/maltodextrin transport system permease protein MalG n=1 Tax=Spirochaeta africana (strain ATCC 700263 / DSM 8902 / Z-7692) TaxID=889378 RepID=H9UM04_SPIAZ|nr:carbohydrate ABC transporter permease [Spirochaeta africana]AFG38547.1 ABC-type sugar transport system, permease component [Spirochaeta africana DSM 8902]